MPGFASYAGPPAHTRPMFLFWCLWVCGSACFGPKLHGCFLQASRQLFLDRAGLRPSQKKQGMSRGTEMRTKSGHLSHPRKPSTKYSATTVQPPFLLTDFRARNRVQKWTPECFPPRITPRGFALRGPGPWAIKVEAPPRNAAGCASAASSRPAEIPTGRHGRLAEKGHDVVPRHHVAWPWHTTR